MPEEEKKPDCDCGFCTGQGGGGKCDPQTCDCDGHELPEGEEITADMIRGCQMGFGLSGPEEARVLLERVAAVSDDPEEQDQEWLRIMDEMGMTK